MQHIRSGLWLSLGGLVVLSTLAIVAMQLLVSPQAQLREAEERWQSQRPAHYRLEIDAGAPCRLDVEIRNERVVAIFHRDSCGYPARTISDLFGVIRRAGPSVSTCAIPYCACRNIIGVYALYDPQQGYPMLIGVHSERIANWTKPAFWQYIASAWQIPDCSWSSDAEIVRVLMLTPLP